MPLIVMCGHPACGKTTRAKQIAAYFQETTNKKVHLINDELLKIDKNVAYASQNEEKKARGTFISAVERFLSVDDIVIADGMNYIKGFRYQLHCVTKAVPTPHCVVECIATKEEIKEWNEKREEKYLPNILEELIARYEMPDSINRWDKPLFTVNSFDELPLAQISDAILLAKAPTPNIATKLAPVTETNFLYEVDRITQEIITEILVAQKTAVIGDMIPISKSSKKVFLSRSIALAELRRIKTQFMNVQKMNTIKDTSKIADVFVDFINPILNS